MLCGRGFEFRMIMMPNCLVLLTLVYRTSFEAFLEKFDKIYSSITLNSYYSKLILLLFLILERFKQIRIAYIYNQSQRDQSIKADRNSLG